MDTTIKASDTIRPVIDWVLERALTEFSLEDLVAGAGEQLTEAGYALHRLHVTTRVLHPIYAGAAFTWVRGQGLELDAFERSDNDREVWLRSPLRYMLENHRQELRFQIHQNEGLEEYPVLQDLRAEGATDYLAILTAFGDPMTAIEREDGVIMTWSSYADQGWTDSDIADLRRLQSRLSVAIRLAMQLTLARNVLSVYLGDDAGKRVLTGQIQRGDGEDIDAVIWFSDLRSSTRLAESLGKDAFLELLNQFFECTAGAVQSNNGEILDYIGDSVMAIFSFEKLGGPSAACRAAVAAGREAIARIAELNEQRCSRNQEALGFGIGLHSGTVMFGNIGIPERLEFTVVGPAANVAARITDQCRGLGEVIVVSDTFRELAGGEWRPLGVFELRNVNAPLALFAPA